MIGARLVLADGPEVLVYPMDRAGYGRLCKLLTLGKRRAEKGECLLYLRDLLENCEEMMGVVVPGRGAVSTTMGGMGNGTPLPVGFAKDQDTGKRVHLPMPPKIVPSRILNIPCFAKHLASGFRLPPPRFYGGDDQTHLAHLAELSKVFDIPLLATNDVYYHDPSRRELQDVLTCVRHHCTMDEAGFRLFANDQRYLKSPEQMHRLFADYPQAICAGGGG